MFAAQVPGADELSHDGMLYLAPMGSAGTPPRPVKWPKLIGKSVVYSLTAWNPMGRDAPQRRSVEPQSWLSLRPAGSPEASLSAGARLRLPQARASLGQSAGWAVLLLAWHMPHRACFRHRYEQNVEANQKLQADLVDWKGNPSPRAWWHSFGFNEKEAWREDGFSVAFAPEERQYARQYISVVKVTPWQCVCLSLCACLWAEGVCAANRPQSLRQACPSSAPAPPQGAPLAAPRGGSVLPG